jgi:hypothetical protein
MLLSIAAAVASIAVLGALLPGWGPGVHIQLTLQLLERLRRRKRLRHSQQLVLENRDAFLYGNIAADIINFKKYGGVKNHCHNWNIHERLAAHAARDDAKAFVLGYLCHLAADLVAHNHFVPYSLVANLPPRLLGHGYWEAMADANVSDREWHTVDRLKARKRMHAFDVLVHHAVPHRVLGLRSNRWIFNNILLISCRRSWRQFIRQHSLQALRHPLDADFLARSMEHSLANMLAVFYVRRFALLKTQDPTGRSALRGAFHLRRELVRDFGSRKRAAAVASSLARQAFGFERRF